MDMEQVTTTEQDSEETAVTFGSFAIPDGRGIIEWSQFIRDSWDQETSEYDLRYSYVVEIYSDNIIVMSGYGAKSKSFRVPYMVESDGEVEFNFDAKEKVELKKEWVSKSFEMTNPLAIKSIGEGRIGAFAVVWGNENRKDADKQWFTKSTSGYLDIFKSLGKLPWLFQHAADGVIKSTVLGEIDAMEIVDDIGIWYEAKILEHDLYKEYVSKLVNSNKLYSSSGALPAAVKSKQTGEITNWVIAEVSGTHTPADYHQVLDGYSVSEIKAHYNRLGITVDGMFEEETDVEFTNKATDGNSEQHDAEKAVDDEKETADDVVMKAKVDLEMSRLRLQKLKLEAL